MKDVLKLKPVKRGKKGKKVVGMKMPKMKL
jgi:hypothetical protein